MTAQASEGEDWKRRYLDTLQTLEERDERLGTAEELLRLALGRLTLAAEKAYPPLEARLSALRQEVKAAPEGRLPLSRLLAQLNELVSELRTLETRSEEVERESHVAPAEAPELDDRAALARRFLAVLLEKLVLTHELEQRKSDLLEALGLPGEGATTVLIDQAAGLVNDMRKQLEHEKDDLAGFLKQLTDTLNELDRDVQSDIELLHDDTGTRLALHDAMDSQMRGLEQDITAVNDVNQLKAIISTRLDRLRAHMTSLRESEDRLLQRMEQTTATMRGRILLLEKETEGLRENLRASRERMLIDALTGIPNRLALDERVKLELARFKRHKQPLTLAVWDIDHFKAINDTFGHKAGDKALRIVAQKLAQEVRETDFVARYGGEEFIMLFINTSVMDALAKADSLRESIAAAPFRYGDKPLRITLSCGLSQLRANDTADQLFERADQALYAAKQGGRNRCVVG
ncbi:diguanylate cyclase [Thiofaba sp. EF100]|jgi:diguanylate cyclase|uniref:diguanylate cyclase n=1 Tax=Thiofaba sp. EF100 TaxID=3121274 RepID=UPI003221EEA4